MPEKTLLWIAFIGFCLWLPTLSYFGFRGSRFPIYHRRFDGPRTLEISSVTLFVSILGTCLGVCGELLSILNIAHKTSGGKDALVWAMLLLINAYAWQATAVWRQAVKKHLGVS